MTKRLIKTREDHAEVRALIDSENGGGGEPSEITSADITDATEVGRNVLTAEDQAAARAAIGAGTSSLALGAGADQAASGADLAALTARVVALENAAGG